MKQFTVKELAKITKGRLFSKNPEYIPGGFSTDSRTINPEEFFIAIKGKRFNGHDFAGSAAAKGASGLISERSETLSQVEKRFGHVITVDDARAAMGMVAKAIRKRSGATVVCITGTNGKTTVKNILAILLSGKYKVLRSESSFNNLIGLSLTMFKADTAHTAMVLELGIGCSGEMLSLAEIAAPDIAVITNIGRGHLEGLIDRSGVFLEKARLLEVLPRAGVAFLNGDDSFLAKADVKYAAKKLYGTSGGCDSLITGLLRKKDGYDFCINGEKYFLPAHGAHNVLNAAAAVVVAEHLGVDRREVRAKLREISLPAMRLEKVEAGGFFFINDTYNANPDSFESALDVLQDEQGREKGVVAGDMNELGAGSGEFHAMIGKSMAARGVDFLVVLGDMAGHIARGALDAGMKKKRVLYARSHREAAEMIVHAASPGAVILLKGSRLAKMEDVLRCFTTSCIL